MRVRQTSGEFDLALEPRWPLRARRLMQDLERNEPAMTLVAREVYRGLTALPQLPLDRVATGHGRAQALLLHLGEAGIDLPESIECLIQRQQGIGALGDGKFHAIERDPCRGGPIRPAAAARRAIAAGVINEDAPHRPGG